MKGVLMKAFTKYQILRMIYLWCLTRRLNFKDMSNHFFSEVNEHDRNEIVPYFSRMDIEGQLENIVGYYSSGRFEI